MLKIILLCAFSVATVSAVKVASPNFDSILKMGTLLSPAYDRAAVAARLKTLKEGDPRNAWEMSGLREGDIIDPIGTGRNVIIDEKYNWPNNTVVYKYEPGTRRNEKIQIRMAMDMISNGTCIKFREATAKDKDYVYMMYNATGCNSYVGKQNGSQVMNLDRSWCMTYGNVAHELLHAIGLDHQHNTINRDDYVYINFSHVNKDEWHNFQKDTDDEFSDYGLPYDYSSIMHYGRYAFSKYKLVDPAWGSEYWSIVPHPDETVEIGQTRFVSKIDLLKVNIKYKCPGYEGPQIIIDTNSWQAKPGRR